MAARHIRHVRRCRFGPSRQVHRVEWLEKPTRLAPAGNEGLDHNLIQQIYTAGVHPKRFEELLTSWEAAIAETFGSNEVSVLDTPEIVAHVHQAVAMLDTLGPPAEPTTRGAEWSGLRSAYPVMLCDRSGRIHHANVPALQHYGAEHVEQLPFDAQSLDAIREAVANGARDPAAQTTVIPARSASPERPPTVVSAHPYRDASGEHPPLVQLTSNELAWPAGLDGELQQTFGLSAAECGVVRLMAEGASTSQIAERRGSTVATVRVQLRSVYEKTGVRSQPELLRLAIGFVGLFNLTRADDSIDPAAPAPLICHPAANERHLLMLPDGRRLDYADFGDPAGHPVVFLHDEYYGRCWSGEMVGRARVLGLRIIAPARPYYGQSDGYPQGVDSTRQVTRDLEVLADHLDLGRFVILARRTGFRFAIEAAHQMTGRVAGLVALSPALPARSVDDYQHMTGLSRFIAVATVKNPALVELACRAGIRYHRQMGARRFARLLNRASAEDLAVLQDPAHWQLIRRGMEFSLANGHLGYLSDVRHDPQRTWTRTITCPVHIRCLIGELDPNDRIARAERCINAGADLSITRVQHAGQLFYFSHAGRILDEVSAASGRTAPA